MTDYDMYVLLRKKSLNIKMHLNPEDVAEIAERFLELSQMASRDNDDCLPEHEPDEDSWG